VTGANGFVGRALGDLLQARGHLVRGAVRSLEADDRGALDVVETGVLGPETRWEPALAAVSVVVHLAARVHVVRDAAADPLAEFRRVNVEGTRRLAMQAAAAGVRRMVLLSSVKVHGESSAHPLTECDRPCPEDAYGISKWEAEQILAEVGRQTGLEWVVLRPPLTYGPGVKANFYALLRAVARGLPLPLSAIDNRRSLLYLGNLVDAIGVCLQHPAAANRTFLVSDGEDLSSPELVRRMARALGVRARLVPVPVGLLRLAGSALGRRDAVARLVGSMQIDSSLIRRELSWAPPYTVDRGLADTARWFLSQPGTRFGAPRAG